MHLIHHGRHRTIQENNREPTPVHKYTILEQIKGHNWSALRKVKKAKTVKQNKGHSYANFAMQWNNPMQDFNYKCCNLKIFNYCVSLKILVGKSIEEAEIKSQSYSAFGNVRKQSNSMQVFIHAQLQLKNLRLWWQTLLTYITCGIGIQDIISRIPHPIISLLIGCQRSTCFM